MTAVTELYEMVQEGKRLLILWKRSRGLKPEALRKLRADTKTHLGLSSTAIINRALPNIVPHSVGGKMGRVAQGTKLAVREMTDQELGAHVKRLMDLDDKPWERGVHPTRWVVCFAEDLEQVLFDWFSPVGGYNEALARESAERYVRGRGAVLVEAA